MTAPSKQTPAPDPGASLAPAGVRYSLPDLLREVEAERHVAAFTMEKLDQVEITKLFEKRRTRRVRRTRK